MRYTEMQWISLLLCEEIDMTDYVDVNDFVSECDRREAFQAALTGDVGDNDNNDDLGVFNDNDGE
jgi:hypothetical protein